MLASAIGPRSNLPEEIDTLTNEVVRLAELVSPVSDAREFKVPMRAAPAALPVVSVSYDPAAQVLTMQHAQPLPRELVNHLHRYVADIAAAHGDKLSSEEPAEVEKAISRSIANELHDLVYKRRLRFDANVGLQGMWRFRAEERWVP